MYLFVDGSLKLDARIAFEEYAKLGVLAHCHKLTWRNASHISAPKHATSPVEAISTPNVGSAPLQNRFKTQVQSEQAKRYRRRVKENIGAFTAT
jgi:hypothetical protein